MLFFRWASIGVAFFAVFIGSLTLTGCDQDVRARSAIVSPAPPFDNSQLTPMSILAQSARIPVFDLRDDAPIETVLSDLARNGGKAISPLDLHRHLAQGDAPPPGACVLTFDDPGQRFYQTAIPLLQERKTPFALFLDASADAPDANSLRDLDKDGTATIGVHLTIPPDAGDDPYYLENLSKRLEKSKEFLEGAVGHPVVYLSLSGEPPSIAVRDLAGRIGFTLAFDDQPGPAEESPDILGVNRYPGDRIAAAWEECGRDLVCAPAGVVNRPLSKSPVRLSLAEYGGVKLGLAFGGSPITLRTLGRKSVGDFVKLAGGAAGINGTFFADAKIQSDDNILIGPNRTISDEEFHPERAAYLLPHLRNRPMVLIGPTHIAFFPFQPESMNDEAPLRRFMPDYTDAFVAGGWIVHNGAPQTDESLQPFAVDNYRDPRRRAFFGIDRQGEAVLGASREVVTTDRLAKAAAAAGVQEAILLDSGFSTSLIYGDKIVVTGHTAPNLPSRPVPHAIVLLGKLAGPPPADIDDANVILRPSRRADSRRASKTPSA